MPDEVKLNANQFFSRVQTVISAWNNAGKVPEYESLVGVDALLVLIGDPAAEDEPDRKSTAFQIWLLGYEFPSTLLLIQKDKISFLCSAGKAKFLNQLDTPNSPLPIEILLQAKPKDPPTDSIAKLVTRLLSGKRIGTLTKEQHTGRLVDEWKTAIEASEHKFDNVDISASLSACMAVKDAEELKLIRTSANLASVLLSSHFVPKLELILDRGSKTTHQALADSIEARIGDGSKPDMKVFSKAKSPTEIDFTSVEFVYPPIVQSNSTSGGYDVKFSAMSTDDPMSHEGILLVAIGLKYKGYSANMARTFLVDAKKTEEQNYGLLLTLQSEALSKLKEGILAREVYQHIVNTVKAKSPELEKYLPKNIGWGMGLEFRDSSYVLSGKNSRALKAGMVFNLVLSLTDVPSDNGKLYSLLLTDTVKVGEEKGVCLTEGMKTFKDVLFSFNDEETDTKAKAKSSGAHDDVKPSKNKSGAAPELKGVKAGSKVLRAKTRGQHVDPEAVTSSLARIAAHQKELHTQRQEEGIARFAGEDSKDGREDGKGWKKFQSYKGDAALPKETESLRIFVDRKASTVILPVHGHAVPFHINTLKNASKSDEGEFTYLRINFQTPGQLAGKKEDTPFEDPNATFIRSVTYRSTDGHRFDTLCKQIQELKKEVNKREQERKAMADVIEQDSLLEIKGKRPPRLPEVFVRPATDGKRLPGDLEIHQNGLRYVSPLGQKIDLLFSNIKHLFFQPCDNEMLVIIHMHLKSPIMIGKKKTKDVQVYREASDVQFDETGNRKRKYRYGDEDEIELEQQERKRRQALNKEFKYFAEKIAEASDDRLEVDIPFSELAFEGVPFRTNVKLQPTTDCLIHLSDPPFLVVTLADIEIASLERVQFGLKQFDLVFIFKDFSRPPLHLNSIPSNQLDNVKEWLDSVEVPLAEGPVNLNWSNIMKNVNESPYEFFKEGGWSFLGGTGGGEDGSDRSTESEESEFEVEGDDDLSSSSYSESSDSGSFASDDSGSDASGGGGSDSESGDDWDELERKAAKSDKKKAEDGRGHASDDDDSDRPKKKAPAGKSKKR
ncbi:FACT complex subunit spt16 [Tulasnella sp. JGI-2019a]|nr:FACT complex subunit spt16 [Tulasnella sp. JGI-2019a]KAG9036478.1 FACT complex subunit spt16 [Tulasnella sp. JGI-2019a]